MYKRGCVGVGPSRAHLPLRPSVVLGRPETRVGRPRWDLPNLHTRRDGLCTPRSARCSAAHFVRFRTPGVAETVQRLHRMHGRRGPEGRAAPTSSCSPLGACGSSFRTPGGTGCADFVVLATRSLRLLVSNPRRDGLRRLRRARHSEPAAPRFEPPALPRGFGATLGRNEERPRSRDLSSLHTRRDSNPQPPDP